MRSIGRAKVDGCLFKERQSQDLVAPSAEKLAVLQIRYHFFGWERFHVKRTVAFAHVSGLMSLGSSVWYIPILRDSTGIPTQAGSGVHGIRMRRKSSELILSALILPEVDKNAAARNDGLFSFSSGIEAYLCDLSTELVPALAWLTRVEGTVDSALAPFCLDAPALSRVLVTFS